MIARQAAVDERTDLADRADVESLVRDFYRQAAMDDLLGPVFEAATLGRRLD